MSVPARDSGSEFLRVRGLRYHVRRWGRPGSPRLMLLHGWLDVSATWEPLVRELLRLTEDGWEIIAPDWRGFGYSEWPQDGYWFHDYLGDLEALLDHYAPDAPATLVSHSMGAQAASLYAGLRPERVGRLVLIDGLFLPNMPPEKAPKRVRRWLDQLKAPPRQKSYVSFDELATRVRRVHPRLSAERAAFIARCWGREDGRGAITLCADPKHRLDGPGLYRAEESEVIWREVTARTCFIDAAESEFRHVLSAEDLARRRACFRSHECHQVGDSGHMLHFDAPQATAQVIAGFLAAAPG